MDESRSISGYVFILSGGVILWYSRKQDCLALLIMEAKYVSHGLVTHEAI